MGRKKLAVMVLSIGVLLFLFAGEIQVFEGSGSAYAAVVEPHCSDGDCSDYALWCKSVGRIAMCLNADTENEVTVCISPSALAPLFNNRPNTCIGTCAYAEICNSELDQ